MTDEREAELRRLANQYERCDFVRDLREHGGIRFSFHDALIEALDAVRALRPPPGITIASREIDYDEEIVPRPDYPCGGCLRCGGKREHEPDRCKIPGTPGSYPDDPYDP